jgi:dihydropteroate synthase
VRFLAIDNPADLGRELAAVGAGPDCWPIFAAKSRVLAIRLAGLSVATANILKQAALTCGADCAVHRDVISGKVRTSDAILFATPRQLDALLARLAVQPHCVARLVPELRSLAETAGRPVPGIRLGKVTVELSDRTRVMGILNVTPDSFSDGGRFLEPQAACDHALAMEADGAEFIDIGAESTRPGAKPVPARTQLARLLPVLRLLKRRARVPVSIDTTSAAVAEAALKEGAGMVNDVTALSDPKLARLVARAGVPCVLMHMQGRPRTMQENPQYRDLMAEVVEFLGRAVERAVRAGVERSQVIVDPGIGFGKTVEHNIEILRRLAELGSLGRPILAGPSRKRFIGALTGAGPAERLEGTIAACVRAAANGANILRVHDVKPVVRALKLSDAITGAA